MPDDVRNNPMLSPIPPLVPVADRLSFLLAEPDSQVGYDPAVDYAVARRPVFLQYGAQDTSVPVHPSIDAIRAAAPDATIVVYPDLEHMLNTLPEGVVGLPPETAMYGFHRFEFGPTVARDLTAWLRMNVVNPAPHNSGAQPTA